MTRKIALITGANKGIGWETARQLGQQNITVVIGARDPKKGEASAKTLRDQGIDARAIPLDVTDQKSIASAAAAVERDFGHLDILVNNAGVMLEDPDQPSKVRGLDVWRQTFDTNVFGLIATTEAFLPLLHKSDAGRIVNLSSILGSIAYQATPGSPTYGFSRPAYNVSKAAVNAYTVQLAYQLKDTNIKVNAAHPGWVKTEMGGEGATMEIVDGAKTSVALATAGDDGPNGAYLHMGERLPW
jgi:NAD(P)-dependent dehydrogenase (short-subunit alcohol dehydrogenase family)